MEDGPQIENNETPRNSSKRNIMTVSLIMFFVVMSIVVFFMLSISSNGSTSQVTPTIASRVIPTQQLITIEDLAPIQEQISTLELLRDNVQSIKATLTAAPNIESIQSTAQAEMETLITQVKFEVNVQLNNISSDIEDIDESISSINRGISELETDFEVMSTRVGDAEIRLATLEAPMTATAVEATRRAVEVCVLIPEVKGGAYPLYVSPSFESSQTGTEYVTETDNDDERWIVVAQTSGTPNQAGHWWAVKPFNSISDDAIAGYVPSSQVIEIPLENCVSKPTMNK